jgi:ABC-type antimicrobial peptide transport system permease subunit
MGVSQWGVLIATQPGPAGSAAVSSISHRFPKFVNPNVTPADLVNFGTAVNFPLLLGVILAALGAGTFAHLLVVTVARRRRDFGLLKALGFVRAQLVATVSWQATTIALVAVAVGVPVGVAAGRIIWHTFAFNLGAVPREVVPAWTVVALGAGVILGANLLALAPALTAMRLRPSVALREP